VALRYAFAVGRRALKPMLRELAFNEDQPRDEQGQWTSGGSGTSSTKKGWPANHAIQSTIGQIDPHGVVETRHYSDPEGANQVDHSSTMFPSTGVFGIVMHPSSRFRMEQGHVWWLDPPTKENYFRVEDYYANRGLKLIDHSVMSGRGKVDPEQLKSEDEQFRDASMRSASRATDLADRASAAMRTALDSVLYPTLLRVVAAGGEAGAALLMKQLRAASHKFATTQVNLPPDLAARFAAFPIAPEDLSPEHGREMTPHVTVKYGLVDASPDDVRDALAGEAPFTLTFGKTATFAGVEDGTADAVIVGVESEDLGRLNALVADAVETIDSHPEYKPHATIAYVKLGRGKDYAGDKSFVGLTVRVDSIVFSGKDDEVHEVGLVGTRMRAAADSLKMRFDVTNPRVIEWAKRHAADLVTQIAETTRDRIRLAVEELQEEGDVDLAHDRILHAVGDEDRATLIARHETMMAAHAGQRESWNQAVDAGLLTGDEERTWIVTPDERLCPICEGLEDKRAKLHEPFVGNDGNEYDGPPAHIQCRCTEGIA